MLIITSFCNIICFLCFSISTIPSPFMTCCFLLVAVSILVQLRPSYCCCSSLSVNCPFHFHTTHTFFSLPSILLRWYTQIVFSRSINSAVFSRTMQSDVFSSECFPWMISEDITKSWVSLLVPYIELLKRYKRITITFSSFFFHYPPSLAVLLFVIC